MILTFVFVLLLLDEGCELLNEIEHMDARPEWILDEFHGQIDAFGIRRIELLVILFGKNPIHLHSVVKPLFHHILEDKLRVIFRVYGATQRDSVGSTE